MTSFSSHVSLADNDDDVRAVAAACLLPVAEEIATRLPLPDLENLLEVLWDTFLDESDELNSSIASVMALLGKLTIKRILFCMVDLFDTQAAC